MKLQTPFREPVRVLRHGDGGITYVAVTRYESVTWDIPTERIPFHLRGIGSEFLVIMPRFTPEGHDTPDEIRQLCASVEVHELQPGETFTQP